MPERLVGALRDIVELAMLGAFVAMIGLAARAFAG